MSIVKELEEKFGSLDSTYGQSLSWGRTKIRPDVGRIVPIPPQAEGEFFTDFEVPEAEALAAELRKLQGKPVILTGGGGYGIQFALLDAVRVEISKRPLRKPNGHLIRGWNDEVGYREDAPPIASVQPILKALPGYPFPNPYRDDKKTWTPFIGSYRIVALYGYGAEDLSPTPEGWEEE